MTREQRQIKDDQKIYENSQRAKMIEWEQRCVNCGACCGLEEGDPCEHLVQDGDACHCLIYENRFGFHKSRSGQTIQCVPIRHILNHSWPGDKRCGYKKI